MSVVLTALGTHQGFQGTLGGIAFDDINRLVAAPTSTTDSLTGMDATATWQLTSADEGSYTSTNTLNPLSVFDQVTGGSGADTFSVTEGVTFAGPVKGGLGHDTLDYSAYSAATPLTFRMTALGTQDGFQGDRRGAGGCIRRFR